MARSVHLCDGSSIACSTRIHHGHTTSEVTSTLTWTLLLAIVSPVLAVHTERPSLEPPPNVVASLRTLSVYLLAMLITDCYVVADWSFPAASPTPRIADGS